MYPQGHHWEVLLDMNRDVRIGKHCPAELTSDFPFPSQANELHKR
jgi:hypothetical protein